MSSNIEITNSVIAKEALAVLVNELTFTNNVNKQYGKEFARSGAKIGQTYNVRLPVRSTGRRTMTLSVEGQQNTSVPVVMDKVYGEDMNFTSVDLTLSIDDFSNRYIKPAIQTIANMIDFDGLQLYKDIYQSVGTPGTTPSALSTYLDAGVKLSNSACPLNDRKIVLNPRAEATIVNALLNVFNPTRQISDQYVKGMMGTASGFEWYMDQNVAVHTVGTYGGTPLINGTTAQGATSIVTDGWTATTTSLNVGDILIIAGVYGINPQSRQSTGELQQFVVTAQTTTDGSGNSTISVSPALIGPDPVTGAAVAYQTINALPVNNAAITVVGASGAVTPQNMAFHPDAFTFATVDLEELPSIETTYARSEKLGISIRYSQGADLVNSRAIHRLDVLAAWNTIRPELACRIQG